MPETQNAADTTNDTTNKAPRRGKFAKTKISDDLSAIEFSWADGSTDSVRPDMFTEVVQKHLAIHGLAQKLRDSYAGAKDLDFAKSAFRKVLDYLLDEKWAVARTPGEREDPVEVLAQAFVAAVLASKGVEIPLDKAVEKIQSLDRSGRAQLRAIPEVALQIAKIREPKRSLEDFLG